MIPLSLSVQPVEHRGSTPPCGPNPILKPLPHAAFHPALLIDTSSFGVFRQRNPL